MNITGETLGVLLGALGEQLGALGSRVEIVVIGGSALTALGLVRRATRDVDLLAIADKGNSVLLSHFPAHFCPHERPLHETSASTRTG